MALDATAFTLSVSLRDKIGNETTKNYQLTGADHATALTDATAIIAALNGMSKATVLGYTVGSNFKETTVVAPTSDMPISTVVSATTALTTAGKKANWSVNMPEDAVMAGNDLITTHALVIAYQALFIAGGKAKISDGETAAGTSPLKGKLVTRSRSFD